MSLTIWLTGLPSAGKSTLASEVGKLLDKRGLDFEILDGDVMREYLTKDLGFSRLDRDNNVRRIGYVAQLLASHDVIAICPVISPYRQARAEVRQLHPPGRFLEVYIATALALCEERDVKGLYAKARSGEVANMTGIDDPYEVPEAPELTVDTGQRTIEECCDQIFALAMARLDSLATQRPPSQAGTP